MCAVTALSKWYKLSRDLGLEMQGYVFRKRSGHDGFCFFGREKLVSKHFQN